MVLNKKGDLSLRYLVLAIISVIVLIVILIIFSGGIEDFVTKISSFSNEIWSLKPALNTTLK